MFRISSMFFVTRARSFRDSLLPFFTCGSPFWGFLAVPTSAFGVVIQYIGRRILGQLRPSVNWFCRPVSAPSWPCAVTRARMVARTLETFWSVRSRSSNPRVLVLSRYISPIHFGRSGSFCYSKPSPIVRNERNLCTVQTPIHVVYSTVSVRTKILSIRATARSRITARGPQVRSVNTIRYSPLLVLLVLGPIRPTYSITA